ncbi:MAG: ATP-dependent Clp protease proteolytic subunit [bacterium]
MNDNAKEMFNKGIVLITGKTSHETVGYLEEVLSIIVTKMTPPYADLTLVIASNGGGCVLEIYDLLNLFPCKITGIVVGVARSSASIALQACDVRLATPNARILIHHGSTGDINIDCLLNKEKRKIFLKETKDRAERFYDIYTKRSKVSRDKIVKLCYEDRDLYPEDAIKFGLLDGIWNKPLPISATGIDWNAK